MENEAVLVLQRVFVNFLSMHTVLLFILFNLLGLKRKKSCLATRVARTTQASVLGGKSETVNQGPDDDNPMFPPLFFHLLLEENSNNFFTPLMIF